MADTIACLINGQVVVLLDGQAPEPIASPYAEQVARRAQAPVPGHVVGVTRGRVSGELCYAIRAGEISAVFAQKLGTRDEQRLFQAADVQIEDLDFSFGDEAFSFTIAGQDGTSAIGVLGEDGKGVRTVTEGDVLDRGPHWVPGGRGEIVYGSAGIGRTRAGARAGRAPFSLHRLSLKDGTVEVLVSDAKYDYIAPIATSDALIYAIRRAYEASSARPSSGGGLGALLRPLRSLLAPIPRRAEGLEAQRGGRLLVWGSWVRLEPNAEEAANRTATEPHSSRGYELVRITPQRTEVVARGVLAFDVAANGDIVYSNGRALYRTAPAKGSPPKLLTKLERVQQIVVC